MDFTGINELRLRTPWRVDVLLVVRTTIRPDASGYTWGLVDSVRLAAPRG